MRQVLVKENAYNNIKQARMIAIAMRYDATLDSCTGKDNKLLSVWNVGDEQAEGFKEEMSKCITTEAEYYG